eukprot:6200825-Pleurochrysis_carterae.AAC.1
MRVGIGITARQFCTKALLLTNVLAILESSRSMGGRAKRRPTQAFQPCAQLLLFTLVRLQVVLYDHVTRRKTPVCRLVQPSVKAGQRQREGWSALAHRCDFEINVESRMTALVSVADHPVRNVVSKNIRKAMHMVNSPASQGARVILRLASSFSTLGSAPDSANFTVACDARRQNNLVSYCIFIHIYGLQTKVTPSPDPSKLGTHHTVVD